MKFLFRQSLFANLTTVIILVIGVITLNRLNREDFPNIDFDIVSISTAFPGASPEQVERLVTNPIEDEVRTVFGIRDMFSSSTEGLSRVTVIIDPDYHDKDGAVTELQRAVDRVDDLPDDILDQPLVQEIKSTRQPSIQVVLRRTGETTRNYEPSLQLRDFADRLKRELENVEGVAEVQLTGKEDLEFVIEFPSEKLQQLGISVDEVVRAFRSQNVTVPAGEYQSETGNIRYRIDNELSNMERISNVLLRATIDGQSFRVKDIANIRLQQEDSLSYIRSKGRPAMTLGIVKKESADVINVVDRMKEAAEAYVSTENDRLGNEEYAIDYGQDLTIYVRRRLEALSSSIIIGGFLVFLTLLLALNWKTAVIVAVGIPFSFLGAVLLMPSFGFTLNLLTMFGFVVVLGMIVDDAIVVSEAIFSDMEAGKSPGDAAHHGTMRVIKPVLGSVMTSVLAFGPLVFMSGIFGKFVKFIPAIVILCLLVSLVEAFFLLPNHMRDFTRIKPRKGKSRHPFENIRDWYRGVIVWCMRQRYLVLILSFVFIGSAGLAYKNFGQFVLFPKEGIETFFVLFEGDSTLSQDDMVDMIYPFEQKLAQLPDEEVLSLFSSIGQIQTDGEESRRTGENFAQISVFLSPAVSRERTVNEIIAEVEPLLENVPEDSEGRIEKAGGGPPSGKPVNIYFTHEDLGVLRSVASEARAKMKEVKGITSIGDSDLLGKLEYIYEMDFRRILQVGVQPSNVGLGLQMAVDGARLGQVRSEFEKINLKVKVADGESPDNAVENLGVLASTGELIPLEDVLQKVSGEQGIYLISHYQARRAISVYADVVDPEELEKNAVAEKPGKKEGLLDKTKAKGASFWDSLFSSEEKSGPPQVETSEEANAYMAQFFDEWKERFPGLQIFALGENRDTQESLSSLKDSLTYALAGVLFVVVITLGSVWQPMVVLLTSVPAGIAGVLYVFILHNRPLSFLAFFGLVGLVGVAVNVGIVLIDRINSLSKEMGYFDALMEGSVQRLRAVLLTSTTTVLGLMPTAYGWGGGDPFLKPMALALGWGIAFSTLLGIVLCPIVLGISDDVVWFGKRVFRSWKAVVLDSTRRLSFKAYYQELRPIMSELRKCVFSGKPMREGEGDISLGRLKEIDKDRLT